MNTVERPKINETIEMTRRYPNLPNKVLRRDGKIVERLIQIWDTEQDEHKLLVFYLKESKNLSPTDEPNVFMDKNSDLYDLTIFGFVKRENTPINKKQR